MAEQNSNYHDNPLTRYSGIKETRKFIAHKYYSPTTGINAKSYIKGCNVCLNSKSIKYKPNGNL